MLLIYGGKQTITINFKLNEAPNFHLQCKVGVIQHDNLPAYNAIKE